MIHPKQIAAANLAYTPSPEEIEWSRRVIAAHAEASAAGKGVVLVDGKLTEGLHVENARRLLALAEEIDRINSVDTPQPPATNLPPCFIKSVSVSAPSPRA